MIWQGIDKTKRGRGATSERQPLTTPPSLPPSVPWNENMKKAMDELKRASKKRSHSRREKEGREGGVDVLPPRFAFAVSFFFFPSEEVEEEGRRRQATEGAKAKSVAPRLFV